MTKIYKIYKTPAIILKRKNFGEADKILTIFSLHSGKIKVLAKGVRKINSRRGGSLEIFNCCRFVLRRGKDFDLISEVEPILTFREWRKNLKKVAVAYYFCELVDKLLPEGQENKKIFELLKNYLNSLRDFDDLNFVRSFEEFLLEYLGFGVPLDLKKQKRSLKPYIEQIVEKEIKTPRLLLNKLK